MYEASVRRMLKYLKYFLYFEFCILITKIEYFIT